MAVTMASRFSVLCLDVDDDNPRKNLVRKQNKKVNDTKQSAASNQKSDIKKTKKKGTSQPSQNGGAKAKKGSAQGKKKVATQEQWDEWKQKDDQFVEGTYEDELHQAILLSHIDFEEKKDVYEAVKRDQEDEKKNGNKKNKKNKTMSLDQFNSLTEQQIDHGDGTGDHNRAPEPAPVEPDPEFFERIRADAKKELNKEKAVERRKAKGKGVEEAITVAQFEDQLEQRSKEIAELNEEVVKLKEELHNVKMRNKKLCQILGQGEMRDKAQVLIEVDRLQRVKDELSTEVENLHAQLEQERSKVRALTSENRPKEKNKKRTASETAH